MKSPIHRFLTPLLIALPLGAQAWTGDQFQTVVNLQGSGTSAMGKCNINIDEGSMLGTIRCWSDLPNATRVEIREGGPTGPLRFECRDAVNRVCSTPLTQDQIDDWRTVDFHVDLLAPDATRIGGHTLCGEDNSEDLCLAGDRFRVNLDWRSAPTEPLSPGFTFEHSDQTGFFWFFDPGQIELTVQVVDACGFNDRFWVFAAGATNVEYTLRVTDTQTSEVVEYFNPLGTASPPIVDTNAFATCP
jgi:hypothetical protein